MNFNCQSCGKFFTSKRKTSRFCSYKCRGCTKKFQWSKLTYVEKIQHAKKNFDENVIKTDGCWDWKKRKDKNGYGIVPISCNAGNFPRRAHRLSWLIHFGEIPEGLLVCHHCDNCSCANPSHLFLGTSLANMKDKIRKGRHDPSRGEKNGQAKLTKENVLEIKFRLQKGERNCDLAKHFNVSTSRISFIKFNRSWKHLFPDENQ